MIPTLLAGPALAGCLRSLRDQTLPGVEVIVVDNSGQGLVRSQPAAGLTDRIIENQVNAGFGTAINQGFHDSRAPYLATLNDDAIACPGWAEALVRAMEHDGDIGMCASKVLLADGGMLDSAGMLLCGDGSSKQRGHGEPPERYAAPAEVLFPSGSACLFRRRMLEEIGLFDDAFFLYCEDTDLGLRARWAGWKCVFAPEAVVEHRYSHSAGRASPLKAYYVERNRLFTAVKNLPAGDLVKAPFVSLARYFWHAWYLAAGRGAAAEFGRGGGSPLSLPWITLRAHAAAILALGRLWRQRQAIRRNARLTAAEFRALWRRHSISPKQVAAL